MTLSEAGGTIASGSNKQKLNTRSSIKAKHIASDNFFSKILQASKFMAAQGHEILSTLFQNNKSAMILEKRVEAF